MSRRFTSHERMVDVPHIGQCIVCVWGAGRVGKPLARALVEMGVGGICVVDDDTVAMENVVYAAEDVGALKVKVLVAELKAINPDLRFRWVAARVTASNLRRVLGATPEVDCDVFALDDVDVLPALVAETYWECPAVGVLQAAGRGLGEVAWSVPGRTPCLACTMRFGGHRQAAGGQALPLHTNLLANLAAFFVTGLCLRGRRGFGEYFAHFMDYEQCLAVVRTAPIPESAMPPTMPAFVKLVNVVTADSRPGCSVCQGYQSQPE